jgi:hypothetical protein
MQRGKPQPAEQDFKKIDHSAHLEGSGLHCKCKYVEERNLKPRQQQGTSKG